MGFAEWQSGSGSYERCDLCGGHGRPTGLCWSRLRGLDARDADGVARFDDRLDGVADDRGGPRWLLAVAMGGDGVSAGVDDHDTGRGQAWRHVRAQARAAGRARRVPRGFDLVRVEPEHDRADRVSRSAGPGRRRVDGVDAGGDRRCRLAARARALLRLDGRRLRHLDGCRPTARRTLRRPSVVALDLLRQRPDRGRRVHRAAAGAAWATRSA